MFYKLVFSYNVVQGTAWQISASQKLQLIAVQIYALKPQYLGRGGSGPIKYVVFHYRLNYVHFFTNRENPLKGSCYLSLLALLACASIMCYEWNKKGCLVSVSFSPQHPSLRICFSVLSVILLFKFLMTCLRKASWAMLPYSPGTQLANGPKSGEIQNWRRI